MHIDIKPEVRAMKNIRNSCHLRIAAKKQKGHTYLRALLIDRIAKIVMLSIFCIYLYFSRGDLGGLANILKYFN